MEESVILSDGRKINVISFGIASSGHMFIRVNMSMVEAIQAFSSGTDSIVYNQDGGGAIRVNGFTQLAYVVNEDDCVRVALIRPIEVEEVGDNG